MRSSPVVACAFGILTVRQERQYAREASRPSLPRLHALVIRVNPSRQIKCLRSELTLAGRQGFVAGIDLGVERLPGATLHALHQSCGLAQTRQSHFGVACVMSTDRLGGEHLGVREIPATPDTGASVVQRCQTRINILSRGFVGCLGLSRRRCCSVLQCSDRSGLPRRARHRTCRVRRGRSTGWNRGTRRSLRGRRRLVG